MSNKDDNDPITVNVGDIDMSTATGWDPTWDSLMVDTTIDIDTITITDTTTVTIDSFDDRNFTLNPKEFVDYMPCPEKIKDMCKEYPALNEAWEHFRTMYEIVHQDWLDNQDKDDQLPF